MNNQKTPVQDLIHKQISPHKEDHKQTPKEEKEFKQKIQQDTQKKDVLINTKNIVLYALTMSIALAFNDLIVSTFNSLSKGNSVLNKTIYIVAMFGITMWVAIALEHSTE